MTAFSHWNLRLAGAALLPVALLCAGCGTPGAPQPPSLKLPDPVTNLTAVRTGNQVELTWTIPKKNTDKLPIKGEVPARICRKLGEGVCQPVAASVSFAPNAKAAFTDTLPAPLAAGEPRPLSYFVELLSPRGRSAGPSNGARILAGQAPAAVTGLAAQLRKDGVVLSWTADPAADQPETAVRLHRTLLTPATKAPSPGHADARQSLLAPANEPLEQALLVEASSHPGRALDKSIVFNRTYEYRAQRVARLTVDGQTVELAGPLSEPVRVEAVDTFPPAIPTGLAAVATAPEASTPPSIDLSWVPVAEADLAGYAVYRREGAGAWQRISPAQPVVGPGYHDAAVEPGHTYRYAVTAIDQLGHESAKSQQAEETVPSL